MKKDWQKDIHDRMTDFEADEPQGLWEDICNAQAEKAPAIVTAHTHPYQLWMWSAVAAAVTSLLFGGLWLSAHMEGEGATGLQEETLSAAEPIVEEESIQPQYSIYDTALSSGDSRSTAATKGESKRRDSALADSKEMDATNDQATKAMVEEADVEESASTREDNPDASTSTETKPEFHFDQRQAKPSHKPYEAIAQRHNGGSKSPKLTIALATSGGMSADKRQLFQGGQQGASAMLSEAEWVDSPLLGIMAMNRGVETEKKASHHAPIRTGLSVSYPITDRWSLESGISYALIRSEFHEGSSSNYIKEEQKLHYLGIPLGISYKVFSWKQLDLYLSSNLLIEQCIDGQNNRKYFIGDKPQGVDEFCVQSHPTQWSIGAKAGIQYRLIPHLSLYLEPGGIYYFDDHSSLKTVFKERPFDFDLNVGVRVYLNGF